MCESKRKKQLFLPDKLKKEASEQLEKWNKTIGLLTLSSSSENILMWSHYSINYKGFIVGFDTKSMALD